MIGSKMANKSQMMESLRLPKGNQIEDESTNDKKKIRVRQKRINFSTLFTISETNSLYKLFQIFITLLCVFSSCMYANFACFRQDVEMDKPFYENFSED